MPDPRTWYDVNDKPNPFEPPEADQMRPYAPSKDPSVEHEPHQLEGDYLPHEDAHDALAERAREELDHTVWDEPALEQGPTEYAAVRMTYASWLEGKMRAAQTFSPWMIAVAAGCVSGSVALLMVRSLGLQRVFFSLPLSFVDAFVEEAGKVALAICIVEFHPYVFRSKRHLWISGLVGAFSFVVLDRVFAAIVLSPSLMGWRASAYLLLHLACSGCVAAGLARVWHDCIINRHRPRLHEATPYLVLAMAIRVLSAQLLFV